MTTERDELADEIAGHPIGSGYYSTSVGTDDAREIANAILTAGYTKPRQVTTVEELESLWLEAVVMDSDRMIFEKSSTTTAGSWWDMPGVGDAVPSADIGLPATVLYSPVVAP